MKKYIHNKVLVYEKCDDVLRTFDDSFYEIVVLLSNQLDVINKLSLVHIMWETSKCNNAIMKCQKSEPACQKSLI